MEFKEKGIATIEYIMEKWHRTERGKLYAEFVKPISISGKYDTGDVQGQYSGGKFILYPGDFICSFVLHSNKKGASLVTQRRSIQFYLANNLCKYLSQKIKHISFKRRNTDLIVGVNKKFGASLSHDITICDPSIISIHFVISVVKNKHKTKDILACYKTKEYTGQFPFRQKNGICCMQDFGVTYNDLVDWFKTIDLNELEQINIDYYTPNSGNILPYLKDDNMTVECRTSHTKSLVGAIPTV